MAAAKSRDEVGAAQCTTGPHGERRQLQADDPALRAGIQRSDGVCGKIQPHDVLRQAGRLGKHDAQISHADFGQSPRARRWGKGGSVRVRITRCNGEGKWSSKKLRIS